MLVLGIHVVTDDVCQYFIMHIIKNFKYSCYGPTLSQNRASEKHVSSEEEIESFR